MDIINENIPIVNEIIDLIISSSLLNKSNDIIYNSKKGNSLLILFIFYLKIFFGITNKIFSK